GRAAGGGGWGPNVRGRRFSHLRPPAWTMQRSVGRGSPTTLSRHVRGRARGGTTGGRRQHPGRRRTPWRAAFADTPGPAGWGKGSGGFLRPHFRHSIRRSQEKAYNPRKLPRADDPVPRCRRCAGEEPGLRARSILSLERSLSDFPGLRLASTLRHEIMGRHAVLPGGKDLMAQLWRCPNGHSWNAV